MAINLIPEEEPNARGCHGDRLDIALLEKSMAKLLELMLAIDDGRDESKSLKGWLEVKVKKGEMVDPTLLGEKVDLIADTLGAIHANLLAARQKN